MPRGCTHRCNIAEIDGERFVPETLERKPGPDDEIHSFDEGVRGQNLYRFTCSTKNCAIVANSYDDVRAAGRKDVEQRFQQVCFRHVNGVHDNVSGVRG